MEIPGAYYAASRGFENLANSMTALGNTFMVLESERRQKEAAAMRLAETSKFVLSVTQDVDRLFTEAERDKPENISKWQQPIADKFQEYWEYINGIQDDPQLKALVTSKHVELQTAYGKKFNDLATKKNLAFAQTQFFNSYDYFLKGYLNAGDEQTESMHMTNLAEAISRAETGGVISPELGNRARNDMEKAINRKTVTKLEGTIAAADELTPEQMVAFRSSLVDPQKNTALTATDRRVLLNQATTAFKASLKERATGAAYDKLYKTTGGNFPVMAEILNDPENRKNLELNMEQTDYLRGFIARAQKDDQDKKTAIYDKTAKDMFLNFSALKPKDVDDAVRLGALDYKTGEHFKDEMKKVAETKTDPATYARFQEEIYEAADHALTRRRIIQSGTLSRQDKEQLLNKTEMQIEKIDARNLTRAMAYLKETVMPSQTMITAAKPEEALNFLKASEAMEAEVLNARKAGKPLNSQQVIEKAQEISQAYRMSTREQIEAAKKRIREEAKKSVVKPIHGAPKKLKYNPATGELE